MTSDLHRLRWRYESHRHAGGTACTTLHRVWIFEMKIHTAWMQLKHSEVKIAQVTVEIPSYDVVGDRAWSVIEDNRVRYVVTCKGQFSFKYPHSKRSRCSAIRRPPKTMLGVSRIGKQAHPKNRPNLTNPLAGKSDTHEGSITSETAPRREDMRGMKCGNWRLVKPAKGHCVWGLKVSRNVHDTACFRTRNQTLHDSNSF